MIEKTLQLPFYAKMTISLIGLLAFFTILYIAQSIILPIVFATMLAIILQPVVHLFMKMKVSRIIAIIFTFLLAAIIILGIFALLYSQLNRLSEAWPILVDKITLMLNQATSGFAHYFDLSPWRVHKWIAQTKSDLISNSGAEIGSTIATVGNGIIVLFIIPVYAIMILYYEPLLLEFIRRLFAETHQEKVKKIVSQIKSVIQRYLIGLVIEFGMVATMYSVALLLLGVEYAILLGIIGALLNVIPYVGGLMAVVLSMMVAIVTKSDGWYAIYVLLSYYIIHLIDYNYIIPKIVASKVKVNALVSVIVIVSAAALLGIPGMIICIPVTGIIKLIFDHITPMEPWGFLLGDTMPSIINIKPIRLKPTKKKTT